MHLNIGIPEQGKDLVDLFFRLRQYFLFSIADIFEQVLPLLFQFLLALQKRSFDILYAPCFAFEQVGFDLVFGDQFLQVSQSADTLFMTVRFKDVVSLVDNRFGQVITSGHLKPVTAARNALFQDVCRRHFLLIKKDGSVGYAIFI